MRAIVRSEHLEFGNSFQAGIDVERVVAAVIHVVAAVQFPIVVLHAATVDAEADIAVNSNGPFVLASLVTYARNQRHQLREVPSIQFELSDLLPGDDTGEIGRLRLYLRDGGSFDLHYGVARANLQRDISASFLSDTQNHTLRFELLEALRRYGHIYRPGRQPGNQIVAAIVCRNGVVNASIRAADPHLRTLDSGPAGIGDGAGDGCGVLSEEARGNNENE